MHYITKIYNLADYFPYVLTIIYLQAIIIKVWIYSVARTRFAKEYLSAIIAK